MGRVMDFLFGPEPPRDEATAAPAVTLMGDDGPRVVSLGTSIAPTVAGYGALMSVDYAACEQTKARSLSTLPWSVVSRGGGWESFPDNPVARLLNGMANEAMTAVDLLNWHRLRCDTFGTAYWRVEWLRGEPVAIWPVLCGVQQDFDASRPRGRRKMFRLAGDKYNPAGNYFADEIISISTHITKNGSRGESLARLAAEQIGLSVDLERFYASMLKNGNHHMGHVEIPDKSIPEAMRADLRTAIEQKSGVDNAGKAPIFSGGAKWVTDQQTMRDASVIEQQTWVLQQVCRACNVPPWKVYDSTGITYSASQQARIDYVTDTIVPDVRAIEQAMAPVFASMGRPDLGLKGNVKGIMRGDDASRSKYYREMAYMGAYTPAMICELEDVDPSGALDRPLFPLNYGTVEPDGSVTVHSQSHAAPADGSQTGATDNQ